jgi:homoserine dehydrogenase
MLVSNNHLFSNINGAKNIIEINSNNLNSTVLMGEGAGRLPTANSVVSDIISIVMKNDNQPFPEEKNIDLNQNYERSFYIRIIVDDKIGIIRTIGELFENYGISIDSIQQIPIVDSNKVPFVITTNNTTINQIEDVCMEIEQIDYVLDKPLYIPIF